MAAEIRVDTIKGRSGINTLSFAGDGFSFDKNVGIGTTVVSDPVSLNNPGKIAVGIVTANQVFTDSINFSGIGTFTAGLRVGSAATLSANGNATYSGIVTAVCLKVGSAHTFAPNGNATISGIATFGGTSHVRLPGGTAAQRPGTAQAGDFRYNTDDGKFEGYTDEWGEIGGGGATQVSGIVSTTSTVGCAISFAHASFRSASVNLLITDATGAYQAGKYLMIHDGTTVTVVEQVAVATGSMLGSISGAINGSNAELKVTMASSGVSTVSAKLDTMAVP